MVLDQINFISIRQPHTDFSDGDEKSAACRKKGAEQSISKDRARQENIHTINPIDSDYNNKMRDIVDW